MAEHSYALTYEKLNSLIADTRVLLSTLCNSQLDENNLERECERLLENSNLRSDCIKDNYLVPFNNN